MTALVLAAVLAGPGMDVPIALRFDTGFDPRMPRLVWRAAHYWNCAIGKQVFQPKGASRVKIKRPSVVIFPVTLRRVDGLAIIHNHLRGEVQIDRRANRESDQYVEHLYRHELGHLLGLDDVLAEDYAWVMHRYFPHDPVHPWDAHEDTLAQVRRWYGIPKPPYPVHMCSGKMLDYPQVVDPRHLTWPPYQE